MSTTHTQNENSTSPQSDDKLRRGVETHGAGFTLTAAEWPCGEIAFVNLFCPPFMYWLAWIVLQVDEVERCRLVLVDHWPSREKFYSSTHYQSLCSKGSIYVHQFLLFSVLK